MLSLFTNVFHMENRFKKGLLLGALLAGVAVAGLLRTQSGQELAEDLKEDAKKIGRKVKRHLADLEDVTRDKYDEIVEEVVEQYSKTKELAVDAKKQLIGALRKKWDEVEKEYQDAKDGE